MVPEYRPFGTIWFWKAMASIVVIHAGIIFGLVWLDLSIPPIIKLPRMLYGLAAIILMLEWRLSLRIIEAFGPSEPE